jgi:hypothetical protein
MGVALYRDEDDCAVVAFGGTIIPVPRWRYEHNIHYTPRFADLPSKAAFLADGGMDYSARVQTVKDIS